MYYEFSFLIAIATKAKSLLACFVELDKISIFATTTNFLAKFSEI